MLSRLVSSGVGLAAEAIEHHRAKSKSPKPESSASQSASSDLPPPYQPSDSTLGGNSGNAYHEGFEDAESEFVSHSDGVTKHDEAVWELDEAAQELNASESSQQANNRAVIPKGVMKDPAKIPVLIDSFVSAYPPIPLQELDPLPCPVILPQRRPEARDRGFVRAYAPLLALSGIDQSAWMQFLDFYDESLKYSNVIKVVRVAGSIAGLVPSAAAMITSAVLQAGAAVAGSVQSRQRSNDFISLMNERWFMPMGMVCLVLKYTPDSETGGFNLEQATSKATGPAYKNLRKAHGATNEAELPAAAPLVFPDIDKVAGIGEGGETTGDAAVDPEQKAKLSRLERSKRFIVDYQDRRARAQFAADNPDSQLAQASKDATKFESSLGDPSKSAGLLDIRQKIHSSVSEYTGLPIGRGRRGLGGGRGLGAGRGLGVGRGLGAGRGIGRAVGNRLGDYDQGASSQRNRGIGLHGAREQPGVLSLVQKVLKKDVLYLMVAPMPSQQEIEQQLALAPQGISIADVQL